MTMFNYFVISAVFGLADLGALIVYLLAVNHDLKAENEHLKNTLDKYYSQGWK